MDKPSGSSIEAGAKQTGGTMNNINPILELSPQMKTAIAMSDALFGGAVKPRKQNEYEMLSEAISLTNRLELLLGKLVPMFNDKKGNLAESQEQVRNLMLNLIAHRRDVEAGEI